MNIKSNRQAPMVLGALTAVATLAVAIPAVYSQSVVKVDGSSTVFPLTEAAAEGFTKATGGKARVTVGVSGTGGGFKKFCRGETDISNASRPILQKEIDECRKAGIKYIELPVAYDGLTVVINKQNTWAKNLTVAELKKMWEPTAQGKITNWNQIRSGFPNLPIRLFAPGTASGTFDYFTEAVNGKSKSSRGDFTASEDDNVLVNGVLRDKGAISYFGYAYYEENKNKLQAVAINGVQPSEATIKSGKYTPLSRPIFIYVNAKSASNPAVQQFVQYYLKNGAAINKKVKYVALPGNVYNSVLARFNQKKTGSVFGGKEKIGVKVNELLATPKD
ncbi:PstS family phosphate ABC transporter substrate-binding protein [Calothrix sp. UHCC 0171]|uniref:PstS family phosphate ABC transporter substrate-binding protein n=1 Tax=Calothrix sp. UHCC 0171 TaxID=3110245 RepID=UPI003A5223FC